MTSVEAVTSALEKLGIKPWGRALAAQAVAILDGFEEDGSGGVTHAACRAEYDVHSATCRSLQQRFDFAGLDPKPIDRNGKPIEAKGPAISIACSTSTRASGRVATRASVLPQVWAVGEDRDDGMHSLMHLHFIAVGRFMDGYSRMRPTQDYPGRATISPA
ncbi:hypothetical protein EMIHUDRAFT_214918 [Emiliania huxleyi CCMP1516]|uniref:Uncharacterized protein n=2 Tax=Emiliania huxleyi TaxID=2903 RepID=A0A0D3IIL9_EMIH1|nr:hypothetical protein EMIHUDRAFT_214918 [Emiliania huxleyi CCMP1516]EOD11104.1 hypothetical protein EMIHUDRAFT_214918 [Emiliania huxleyi CCMP1516]|eukprot:XP_005763533.1 hypothetical protein EMIHUDRAFT_214918 [Emiliania huxleyi CCMP1516]